MKVWPNMKNKNRVIQSMVNIHVKGRYLLLESFNPKASFQSGDLGSDGIAVTYLCITNYSKTQRGRTAILFSHPLVGQRLRRACLPRQISLGVSHGFQYKLTASIKG